MYPALTSRWESTLDPREVQNRANQIHGRIFPDLAAPMDGILNVLMFTSYLSASYEYKHVFVRVQSILLRTLNTGNLVHVCALIVRYVPSVPFSCNVSQKKRKLPPWHCHCHPPFPKTSIPTIFLLHAHARLCFEIQVEA
jgi:hypothetical protein